MPTEINEVRPSSLNHLVGNKRVVSQVRTALDASFQDSVRFPHTAIWGSAGLGKSTIASLIAQEQAVPFHEVLGQNLQKPADLADLLLKATDKSVVFVDECHELPKKMIQTSLYTCLDQRVLKIQGGKSIHSLPLNDFTLILATTDEYSILPPLASRMRLTLTLDFYTEEDIEQIIATRARALTWNIDEKILPLIAKRSRSTARRALNILQSSHRTCRAEGENVITVQHLEKACKEDGIDSEGLEKRDRDYLRFLIEKPLKVNVLSSLLSTPVKTLSTHIEPPLIRLGWLTKDDTGRRCLTEKSRTHLKETNDG